VPHHLILLQNLLKFVRNNWRPYSNAKNAPTRLRVLPRDVVKKTMQAEVEEELEKLLAGAELDPASPQYHGKKNIAVSKVLEGLTQTQRAAVEQTAAEWSQKGYPVEEQRR
jgi:hypothetical protein